jgi:hypothetical protein
MKKLKASPAKPQSSKRQPPKSSKQQPPKQQSAKPPAAPRIIFGPTPEGVPLVHRLLEDYRRRYECGDGEAFLYACDVFFTTFQSPKWMRDACFRIVSDWLSHRAATLDDAFGVKRSSKHIAQHREREALRPIIVLELIRLQQAENLSVDAAFLRVGAQINKSSSYVRAVYYERASAGYRGLAALFRHVERLPQ